MEVSRNYLLTVLLIIHIHAGDTTSKKHESKDCQEEGCTNHNNKIFSKTKQENEYEYTRRICSPNKKWRENDESCICSSDGFRMYCTPTNNLRRIRSIRNKRSDNCCNNNGNKQSDNCCNNDGHSNQGRCVNNGCCYIPNNMFNCNGNANFCNCMRNYFFNCMCRNYQNFCCNGNRRKNIKRLSCCDNCCDGQCGSEPNWKCYCTHKQNTVTNVPNQPSKLNNTNQFSVNIFECDGSTGNVKAIDLNTFYDFCKSHATSNTGSKTEPGKIDLNSVLEFCKQQIDKNSGQVNTNCCSNNKDIKQQINPTQQKQENVNVNTQAKQENVNVNAQPKRERNEEDQEGLKSIFKYMKSYTENEKAEKRKPKPTNEQSRNPPNQEISAKDKKDGLKQIFQYMKSFIDEEKEKRRNIQDAPKSNISPTSARNLHSQNRNKNNKKQNTKPKRNTHPQPEMNHKVWSNSNNPNNKAYKGKNTRQGLFKGRSVVQHLSLDSSGVGDVVTVESNEMVYIDM